MRLCFLFMINGMYVYLYFLLLFSRCGMLEHASLSRMMPLVGDYSSA